MKYPLIGFLFGIESERRIEQEIQVNMACRWFLGLDMDERISDHSIISQNRRGSFNGIGLFRRLFNRIFFQCMEKELVDGRNVLTDSTHGIVADMAVTPGNGNDSGPYLERIEYMRNHLGLTIKTAKADSAYKTSLICRVLEDMGIGLYTPGTTGGVNYKAEFTREDFEYRKKTDYFICPGKKRLALWSLEREEFNI